MLKDKLPLLALIGFAIFVIVYFYRANRSLQSLNEPGGDIFIQDSIRRAKMDSINAVVEAAKRERMQKALAGLRKEHDEMKGITFYYDPTTTKYYDVNSVYAYLATKDSGDVWIRFRIQYTGDDWLFIQNYTFRCDSTLIQYPYSADNTNVLSNGYVAEWCDNNGSELELKIMRAISEAKSVKLRQNGRQFYKDRTLSTKEIAAIKKVLDAYESFK